MWEEIIIDSSLLISMSFIISQIFKSRGISPKSQLQDRILLGILAGIFGCVLIYFSIHITTNVVLDLRNLAEVAVAIFGGPLSVIITGIIIIIFRLFYFGLSTYSYMVSIGIGVISIACALISTINMDIKKKYIIMVVTSTILRSIVFSLVIEEASVLLQLLLAFCIGSILASICAYYFVNYLITAHNLLIQLKESSSKDFLTGLYNTRSFDNFFNSSINDVKEKQEELSLLIVDIDFFKKINDTYGHLVGDLILKEIGKLLVSSCRSFDFISRIGGEEFSIILPDTPKYKAIEVGERIRGNVERHNFILPDGKVIHITASVGVATYPDTVDDIDKILEKADESLYKAKHDGRNKVEIA